MMRIENLGVSQGETAPNFQIKPRLPNNCNERGIEVENNMSKLLGNLDYVLWVRRTEKDGVEDRHKIDLVVGLDKNKKELSIDEVLVQVKASTTGVTTMKHMIRHILRDQPENNMSCEEWMLKNRIVVLVGDVRISRSRKTRWPITNEEIIDSFETQLEKIDNYSRL